MVLPACCGRSRRGVSSPRAGTTDATPIVAEEGRLPVLLAMERASAICADDQKPSEAAATDLDAAKRAAAQTEEAAAETDTCARVASASEGDADAAAADAEAGELVRVLGARNLAQGSDAFSGGGSKRQSWLSACSCSELGSNVDVSEEIVSIDEAPAADKAERSPVQQPLTDHSAADVAGVERSEVVEAQTAAATVPEEMGAEAGSIASAAASELRKCPGVNFSGHWKLAYTEGDMDAFMADMGANWLLRRAGRLVNYGLGRVTIKMSQDGERFKIGKVMADPLKRSAYMEFDVGDRGVRWSDEFGPCTITTSWDTQGAPILHYDVRLVPSGLPSSMKMYFDPNEADMLVEEYSGPTVTIRYFFRK
eukprot:TRINITY_DN21844_c0_g1_i1.p1 TRINITY_DN21844_c0_g1~~TRINITY_DN21844_c0_g1_i1.p1  ORF type:complete len:367 (-),score=82.63 TRINITY_DN21844_c0_g1_i1:125-1225(-)